MRMALLFILLGLARFSWAQAAEPSQKEATTATIRVDTQFVVLDALVENKKTGGIDNSLTAKDFQLSEDGVPQTISYFSHDRLPLSVVLLFDMTETVHAALKPLAQAALEILGHLKPQDEVAVMIFSSRTELLQDFTVNRSLAADAIKTASWMADVEGTFIDEDMYEAVNQALKREGGGQPPCPRLAYGWHCELSKLFYPSNHRPALAGSSPHATGSLTQAPSIRSGGFSTYRQDRGNQLGDDGLGLGFSLLCRRNARRRHSSICRCYRRPGSEHRNQGSCGPPCSLTRSDSSAIYAGI